MNASFNVKKTDNKPVRFITVIVPKDEPGDNPKISASFIDENFNLKTLRLQVKVGKNKKQMLSYEL